MKPMMETHINAHVLARLMAKNAIEQELRSQGIRVTPPREINERATAYIASHPEVWAQALERARQIEEAEEARKARRRKERKKGD
jgi:hypothetical protein